MSDATTIVRPTVEQVAWQEAELTMFLHFGINTFTDREWGDGKEDPHLFNPTHLDARQWTRTAKEAGFKYVILTAKHHDGFCLWPSAHTNHSVKSSPWNEGKGDVVREFADACRADGLQMGLYLSPWDRNAPMYGDSPAYNRYYVAQLTELLTRYGPVAEVWFDGANGEGPNGKKQEYDWAEYYRTIRRLQPQALIAISGPDIRWVGNEDGVARETEWSIQPADPVYHAGRTGEVWWPAECDTSIRPGWFWHPAEDTKVKSREALIDIYFKSVGRNSVFLLNVPPNDRGLLPEPDVARLREFRTDLDRIFAHDLAAGKPVTVTSALVSHGAGLVVNGRANSCWIPAADDLTPTLEIDLGEPATVGISLLQEHIAEGQRVAGYRLDAETASGWSPIVQGTTIGHKKLDRFTPVTARRFRLTLTDFRATPQIRRFGLFAP